MLNVSFKKIRWNQNFLNDFAKINNHPVLQTFLKTESSNYKAKIQPLLPVNYNRKKSRGKPLAQSLSISKITSKQTNTTASMRIQVLFRPRKVYFYYAVAGRRRLKSGGLITYRYQNPQAVATPFYQVFNKTERTQFYKKSYAVCKALIIKLANENG